MVKSHATATPPSERSYQHYKRPRFVISPFALTSTINRDIPFSQRINDTPWFLSAHINRFNHFNSKAESVVSVSVLLTARNYPHETFIQNKILPFYLCLVCYKLAVITGYTLYRHYQSNVHHKRLFLFYFFPSQNCTNKSVEPMKRTHLPVSVLQR